MCFLMYSHVILGHFSSPPDHIQANSPLSFEEFIGNLQVFSFLFFFFFFFTNNGLTPGNVPHIITHVGG